MGQFGSALSRSFSIDGRRRGGGSAVNWGSSTLLDRILDLLIIFRRPVPVPVKTRRRLR